MLNNELRSAPVVRSAQRVLQIVELFAATQRPATLTALSSALGVPKSSCLSLLTTLKAAGYVYEVGPRIGYYPTRQWLERAVAISAGDPLKLTVRPVMEALHAQTGETIILAQRVDRSSCYIDVMEASQNIRYSASVGQRKPLHATASGKALLAALPAPERRALLAGALERLTPQTIVEVDALERDLAHGRRRGWYVTQGETERDVTGVAVALALSGEPYAMVVAGPSYRVAGRIEAIAATLQRATHTLIGRATS